MLQCLLWASLVCAALAQQLPLLTSTHDDSIKTPRIAVIGAGPAGSFAAYSLGHFLPNQDPSWTSEVHLFERSNYIGGRSTTIHLKDASTENEDVYAELGASIFVNANRNLRKAARVFGLTTQDGHGESDHLTNKPFAIYDGERFVFQQSSFKYWDLARLLFWYGRSPFNARKLVRQAIQSFVTLYSAETAAKGPFSMQNYLELLSFGDLVQEPALTYYSRNGVSANFINDIISSACSVNYAQSAFKMHAVGGLVSMAADGMLSSFLCPISKRP
jgi:prenylcysteine oxidase/farnesylcysteine lyase